MKKARILLALLLAVSVFSFAGCGDNKTDGDVNDGTTVEQTTDKASDAGEKLENDAKDLGDDVKDGAEDMLDGTDNTKDGTQNNATKETTK